MIDPPTLKRMTEAVTKQVNSDGRLLDQLRKEINPICNQVHVIRPRSSTAVSFVASDGGNNRLVFDPYYFQLVKVTDSYGKVLCLDVVSPTTDTDELSRAQFDRSGHPITAIGKMMVDLGVDPPLLSNLSYMIPSGKEVRNNPDEVNHSWVQTYRDLCEWAVLYERIMFDTFASDTIIVRDGLLRSKVFAKNLFAKYRQNIEGKIESIYSEHKRSVYLVGLAKHTKVLDRYRLAIGLENLFPAGEPRFVRIPRELERKSYFRSEWASGEETEKDGRISRSVAGDMYLVRFGKSNHDPVWAVDILSSQNAKAQEIFGYLMNDAKDGFPVPFYPRSLQRAHEHAEVVDFDMQIFQDQIYNAIRENLPEEKRTIIDTMQFHTDLARRRYR
ncbi:MAG: hypothetical protein A4E30_00223 [Methanomassiliicoccales archaeon PtaB.Bin215]|nr:MAG: hypothetical protein A4E30_00223 [Methanomassiliicoccales archaeon PtaB.Bin215]